MRAPKNLVKTPQVRGTLPIDKEISLKIDKLRAGLEKSPIKNSIIFLSGSSTEEKLETVTQLGKGLKREVYKIDGAELLSKYIGETEKNLSSFFQKAESSEWILFFDEADALFGKRTKVEDAHGSYANQEVSYLLQRLEKYEGLVLISIQSDKIIDGRYIQRAHSIISFPEKEV